MTDPSPGPDPATPPAAKPAATAEAFARTVLRSRLIDRNRLDDLLAFAPKPARASARALADHLIATTDLTHYQAEKLLRGLWQGLVLGPYHVLAPLGRGGMGTVYLAKRGADVAGDAADPTPAGSPILALKVLPPKRARAEARTLQRFRREMALGLTLAHPNVTRTFDAGEVGGVSYIAMEYVPGQTLRQMVIAGGPLSVADAAHVFADVAAGLAHTHARGLVHRDLKPSNIMVTPDGRAKILDLGLALVAGETPPDDPAVVGSQGYILGTMDYIAPEQAADSSAVGPPADLYALGCSIYYAVTGLPPFPGGTSQQKIKWHRTEEPPAVNALDPAIPAGFARLVSQLMAKRPHDRPSSADVARGLLLPWAGASVTRAAVVPPAPDTAGDAVAGVDTRTFDPSLWDAAPVPVEPAAAPDELPDDAAAWVPGWVPAAVVGAAVAVAAVVLVLLRRL